MPNDRTPPRVPRPNPLPRASSPLVGQLLAKLGCEAETQQKLLEAGSRQAASWSVVVVAAVGAYLARAAGANRASFGVPQMNRLLTGEAGRLGAASARTGCTAVNVLPVSVPATGPGQEQIQQVKVQLERNQNYALARQEDLDRRAQSRGGRLCGAQINILPFDAVLPLDSEQKVTARLHNISAGPVDDLTVCLRGMPGRGHTIDLEVDANPSLYSEEETRALAHRLADWLGRWADSVVQGYSTDQLSLATAPEQLQLEGFNATFQPLDYRSLLDRWQTQLKRSPRAVALVEEATGKEVTYQELDERARRFAAELLSRGVQPSRAVGLYFDRGIEFFVALYGLLYAGCVYVPLASDLPVERIDTACAEARVACTVVGPGLDLPNLTSSQVLSWEELTFSAPEPGLWPGENTGLEDRAYILFTSGSTGKPKGVMVSQRALDNRLAWQQNQIPVGEGQRVLHKTPISFDVHVWELYWPLQHGATVVIAAPGGHRDPAYLARVMVEEKISCLHFVPAMLALLLQSSSARQTLAGHKLALRYLICSGEALLAEQVQASREILGVSPLNLYGPTEAAIDVTYCDTAPLAQGAEVPIGRPVWNTTCRIADSVGQPLPIGYPGELWLAGVQLAEGYINNSQAQERAFITDSLSGQRFYRTGDRACWNADGSITYLGRIEQQVKISGQRLELGEVEATVAAVAGVQAAVALLTDSTRGGKALACLVKAEASAEVIPAAREHCRRLLPSYMVPTLWAQVDDFPLGPSGKIDRRALATFTFPEQTAEGSSPRTLTEQTLCSCFADVLGQQTFGADQNFLHSGGSSLKIIELMAVIENRLGIRVGFAQVYTNPSPQALARQIEREGGSSDTAELLRLRAGQSGHNWFFLPPAGGLGWCYAPYLPYLPVQDAVYALQAPQFSQPRRSYPRTVDEQVEQYLKQILKVGNPRISLVGWSAGGTVAVPLAAAATEAGVAVERVWVLDAYPAQQWEDIAAPDRQETFRALLRMAGLEASSGELSLETTLKLLRSEGSALGYLSDDHLQTALETMQASAAMMRSPSPRVFRGEVTAVSVPHPDQPYLKARGWADFCSALRVHNYEGNHTDLVADNHIRLLMQEILS